MSPEFLNWLTDPAQNGAGSLYDFGCYGVDLMTWLMHGETPLTVTAVLNHDKPEIYPKVRRRLDHCAAVSEGAGRDSGLVELAFCAQGYGSLWRNRLCHHGGPGQAASAARARERRAVDDARAATGRRKHFAQLSCGGAARPDQGRRRSERTWIQILLSCRFWMRRGSLRARGAACGSPSCRSKHLSNGYCGRKEGARAADLQRRAPF